MAHATRNSLEAFDSPIERTISRLYQALIIGRHLRMCSMHRRSDQASGIMPTSGIYGGKTTFASTLSLPISLSFFFSSCSFLHTLAHRLYLRLSPSLSVSRSLCSCLFLRLYFSLPLSLARSRGVAHGSRAAASLAFHYRCSMECIGLSQHLRRPSPRNWP